MVRALLNRYLFLFALLTSVPTHADFDTAALGLKQCGTGQVKQALSGDKIELISGAHIKLADIKAPEHWEQPSQYKSWPYGFYARNQLDALVKGRKITLHCYKKSVNFLGVTVAHIILEDNDWLQAELLSQGIAFLYPEAQSSTAVHSLYAIEDAAQRSGKGIWAKDTYTPKSALDTDFRSGWFQIIAGTVISAKQVRKTIYLNFGDNWREDFTIEIPKRVFTAMKKAGLNPLDLENKPVEVRGIIEWGGGPKIILTSPNRLRLLERN